jgi:hypothetical protein
MAPKNPKPYVNSVLQLESKKFATLKNLDGLLELLKDVKKAQKPKCDQGDSSNTEVVFDRFLTLLRFISEISVYRTQGSS